MDTGKEPHRAAAMNSTELALKADHIEQGLDPADLPYLSTSQPLPPATAVKAADGHYYSID